MSTDIATLKRQIKIKSGAAKRYVMIRFQNGARAHKIITSSLDNSLTKENGMYRKEAEEMKRKLDKLIADGNSSDEWDVKNAVSRKNTHFISPSSNV
jgi:tubulin-specific chaperone A